MTREKGFMLKGCKTDKKELQTDLSNLASESS